MSKTYVSWQDFVIPPTPLSQEGDIVKNWRRWKESFLICMKSFGPETKINGKKYLQLMIGPVGLEALKQIKKKDPWEEDSLDVILAKLTVYFDTPKNEAAVRYKFFTRKWESNEALLPYITDLKELAKACNFGNLAESLIRDQIVLQIKDQNLQRKLLAEERLDVQGIIKIYKAYVKEDVKKDVAKHVQDKNVSIQKEVLVKASAKKNQSKVQPPKQVEKGAETQLNQSKKNNVKTEKTKSIEDKNNKEVDTRLKESKKQSEEQPEKQLPFKKPCWKCHTSHAFKNCPARGHKCEKCSELNHYTQCCKKWKQENNTEKDNKASVEPSAPNLSSITDPLYPNLEAMKRQQYPLNPYMLAHMSPPPYYMPPPNMPPPNTMPPNMPPPNTMPPNMMPPNMTKR